MVQQIQDSCFSTPSWAVVGDRTISVSDPYSLNPDPDLAKNLNPDPSYFLQLSEFFLKLLISLRFSYQKKSIERQNVVNFTKKSEISALYGKTKKNSQIYSEVADSNLLYQVIFLKISVSIFLKYISLNQLLRIQQGICLSLC